MVHVTIVMMWYPCYSPMHCHRSQSSDTYPNVVHKSQGNIMDLEACYIDPDARLPLGVVGPTSLQAIRWRTLSDFS